MNPDELNLWSLELISVRMNITNPQDNQFRDIAKVSHWKAKKYNPKPDEWMSLCEQLIYIVKKSLLCRSKDLHCKEDNCGHCPDVT